MLSPSNDVPLIDIPFEYRHHCWFCGEPNQFYFSFPPEETDFPTHFGATHFTVPDCIHPNLTVPSCGECLRLSKAADADSIWQVKAAVKRQLIHIYRKDLAIGLNWTQEELATSEFEGGNFEGFKRSAWFMYEVAQGRVNFNGWPISLNGIELEPPIESQAFTFDGMTYPCFEDAIDHYCKTFKINKDYLKAVVYKVGIARFAYAVRYCRLFVGATPNEMKQGLKDLA